MQLKSAAALSTTKYKTTVLHMRFFAIAKGIWKKVLILQVGVPTHAPPMPPVIRVVLLHTETADKDLCSDTVYR